MQKLLVDPIRPLVLLFVACALSPSGSMAQDVEPERIFLGGKVLTVDAGFSIVEAIAVAGDKILAVGSDEEIAGLAGPDTRVIELNGRTVIPGLIDNHSHMTSAARDWSRTVVLEGVLTRQAALDRIAAKAAAAAPGEWIFSLRGWTPGQFEDRPGSFTREELDRAAPDNPVLVAAGIDRTGTANSLALAAAEIESTDGLVDGAAAVNSISQAADEPGSWQHFQD